MTDTATAEFIKELGRISNAHATTQVFADVVRAMRVALQRPVERDADYSADLERQYMALVDKYGAANWQHAANCMALVIQRLEERREDFLGHILEEIGANNTHNGQFFTPVSVSRLMARVNCHPVLADYQRGRPITICDPACGAGVLLIEAAEYLRQHGVRQGDLLIVAGDIDGRACDICYTQLNLLGYPAIVCHQDGISLKMYERPAYTSGWYIHGLPLRGIDGERYISRRLPPKTATAPVLPTCKPQPPPRPKDAPLIVNVNSNAPAQMEFNL